VPPKYTNAQQTKIYHMDLSSILFLYACLSKLDACLHLFQAEQVIQPIVYPIFFVLIAINGDKMNVISGSLSQVKLKSTLNLRTSS
jgi:hypothetical protein